MEGPSVMQLDLKICLLDVFCDLFSNKQQTSFSLQAPYNIKTPPNYTKICMWLVDGVITFFNRLPHVENLPPQWYTQWLIVWIFASVFYVPINITFISVGKVSLMWLFFTPIIDNIDMDLIDNIDICYCCLANLL